MKISVITRDIQSTKVFAFEKEQYSSELLEAVKSINGNEILAVFEHENFLIINQNILINSAEKLNEHYGSVSNLEKEEKGYVLLENALKAS